MASSMHVTYPNSDVGIDIETNMTPYKNNTLDKIFDGIIGSDNQFCSNSTTSTSNYIKFTFQDNTIKINSITFKTMENIRQRLELYDINDALVFSMNDIQNKNETKIELGGLNIKYFLIKCIENNSNWWRFDEIFLDLGRTNIDIYNDIITITENLESIKIQYDVNLTDLPNNAVIQKIYKNTVSEGNLIHQIPLNLIIPSKTLNNKIIGGFKNV